MLLLSIANLTNTRTLTHLLQSNFAQFGSKFFASEFSLFTFFFSLTFGTIMFMFVFVQFDSLILVFVYYSSQYFFFFCCIKCANNSSIHRSGCFGCRLSSAYQHFYISPFSKLIFLILEFVLIILYAMVLDVCVFSLLVLLCFEAIYFVFTVNYTPQD